MAASHYSHRWSPLRISPLHTVTSRSQLALYFTSSPKQQLRTHLRGHREGELSIGQAFCVLPMAAISRERNPSRVKKVLNAN